MKIKYLTLRVIPNDEATYEKRKKQVAKIAKMYSKQKGRKVSLNEARNILIEETSNNLKT